MVLGIVIGYIASQSGFHAIGKEAIAQTPQAVSEPAAQSVKEPPAPDLSTEPLIDGFPASMQPWRVPGDPLTMKLDPGWDMYFSPPKT